MFGAVLVAACFSVAVLEGAKAAADNAKIERTAIADMR